MNVDCDISEEILHSFINKINASSNGYLSIQNHLVDSNNIEYQTIPSASTSSPVFIPNYFVKFPRNIDIISNSLIKIRDIEDSSVKKQVVTVLSIIQQNLLTIFEDGDMNSILLPPLLINPNDDGSVLIEWIFRDFRIGLSLELNSSESSWYLISNRRLDEISYSGLISEYNLQSLIAVIITFALSFT